MKLVYKNWLLPQKDNSYLITGFLYDTSTKPTTKVSLYALYFKSSNSLSLASGAYHTEEQLAYMEKSLRRKFKLNKIPLSCVRVPSKKDRDLLKETFYN